MPEKYRRPHTHERVQAVERMKRDLEAQRQALATVRRFNAARQGMVLAQDRRRPRLEASLAGHCLRRLRQHCRSRLAR